MARRTKLNAQVQKNITDALSAGNYFDAACAYVGITVTTGYNWLARGRAELERREANGIKEDTKQWKREQPFIEFLDAVTRASATVEVTTIAKIKQAGGDDWRALSWFMEHRYPDKWGKRVNKNEHAGVVEFKLIYPDND